jgi:hypothetical protein
LSFLPGLAGLLVSISRILTKSFVPDKKSSTVLFFIISIVIILACIYTYVKVALISDCKNGKDIGDFLVDNYSINFLDI